MTLFDGANKRFLTVGFIIIIILIVLIVREM